VAGVLAAAACVSAAEEVSNFVYRSEGIEYTVSTAGLSRIRVGKRVVAEGGWRLWNPGGTFESVACDVDVGGVRTAALNRIDERTCEVRHGHVQCDAVYTYAFEGEDATVTARVVNRSAAELKVAAFRGLTFRFAAEPKGILRHHSAHYIEFNQGLVSHCYPSHASPIGGSYGSDGEVGVGLTPLDLKFQRALFLWWGSETNKAPMYFRPQPVPAGGATATLSARRTARSITSRTTGRSRCPAAGRGTTPHRRTRSDSTAIGAGWIRRGAWRRSATPSFPG
jgi:hypothetical protein